MPPCIVSKRACMKRCEAMAGNDGSQRAPTPTLPRKWGRKTFGIKGRKRAPTFSPAWCALRRAGRLPPKRERGPAASGAGDDGHLGCFSIPVRCCPKPAIRRSALPLPLAGEGWGGGSLIGAASGRSGFSRCVHAMAARGNGVHSSSFRAGTPKGAHFNSSTASARHAR